MNRRIFLKRAGSAGIVVGAAGLAAQLSGAQQEKEQTSSTMHISAASTDLKLHKSPGELKGEMLYRELGKTGVKVSAIGLGGFHIAKPGLEEAEGIRIIQQAIDRGITFMDNSWDYNKGQSEIRMGKALGGGRRDKVFLMTKIDGRDKVTAAKQIDECLQRLTTDHIDLMMHHEIIRFDDADRIFAEGGAQEAMLEAQKAGKIKFIGFTGHKDPRIHLYMLELAAKNNQHMDAVLMPINVLDAHYRSFSREVLPKLIEQNIGVLSMKCFAGGDAIVLKTKTATAPECLQFALSLASTVITGIDKQEVLDQAFAATKSFKLLDQAQANAILEKTLQVAMTGKYELFKTSAHFDATASHAEWLGGETPAVKQIAPGQG